MKEKDLPIDRSRHAVYTKRAKKCVRNLLLRCYDRKTADGLWEKIQLRYAEYLKDEPALRDLKITTSIYDPILIFAWYAEAPEKPPREEIQREVCRSFFGSFDVLGKIFDMNRPGDNRLAERIFRKANEIRMEEIKRFPESFRVIEDAAVRGCAEIEKKLIRLMRLPGMKGLFLRAWDPMTRKLFGAGNGFSNVFYPRRKGEYRMDVTSCPYCRYLTELGCPELTKIFCENDERIYGRLPGLKFERTGTLGKGAERCDFRLVKT